MTNISSLDLNLLKVFDALLRERSVTRAAVAVGLSQPAASHALSRLRQIFADELFIRLPHGMEPTPRALELGELVSAALAKVRHALDISQGFEPATTARLFSLGMTEYAQVVLAGTLAERFTHEAPNANLLILPINFTTLIERLESDRITLAIGTAREPTPRYHRRPLYQDRLAIIARRDDPIVEQPMTVEAYAAARHVLVAPAGRTPGNIDSVLLGRNLRRRIVLTLSTYMAVPAVLRSAHMLVTLPRMVGRHLVRQDPTLVLLEMPFERPVDLGLFWHPRHDADPGERWIRQMAIELGQRLTQDGAPAAVSQSL